jgi:hypothetical protein
LKVYNKRTGRLEKLPTGTPQGGTTTRCAEEIVVPRLFCGLYCPI